MAMDTYKGWPLDGALNDNIEPLDGAGIIAGMAVKKDAAGKLIKADGTAGEQAFFSLEDQEDYAVVGAKKMAVVVSNAIMLTDQFDAGGVYGFDTDIQVDAAANAGKFKPHTGGGAPVFAKSDGKVTRDGKEYLKLIIR